MHLSFAEDSRQDRPGRPGMGGLVATGAITIADSEARRVTLEIDEICRGAGFPERTDAGPSVGEFKWSPGRELWMRDGLVGDARAEFFTRVLQLLASADAKVSVVIVDRTERRANTGTTPEMDAMILLMERVQRALIDSNQHGLLFVDVPSGGRRSEHRFLSECAQSLAMGTRFLKFDRFILPAATVPSHLFRLIQAADLVTGCSLSYIAGERTYSPAIFEHIKPLLRRNSGRTGGVGMKLYPDVKYANLYHWLLEDSHFWRMNVGMPLPHGRFPYAAAPDAP